MHEKPFSTTRTPIKHPLLKLMIKTGSPTEQVQVDMHNDS